MVILINIIGHINKWRVYMKNEMERVNKILNREFGKHRKMYLAISVNHRPKVKQVTTYYDHERFYLICDEGDEIIQKISCNEMVSLCSCASFHKFKGQAKNLGNPFKKENEQIRLLLTNKEANDEQTLDTELCLLEIQITSAFIYANKMGYDIDFTKRDVKTYRFTPYT